METGNDYARCLSFINCQLQPPRGPLRAEPDGLPRMGVTISRQTGSGAMEIAQRLANYLESLSPEGCPWAVFDRNLVERVLEEHHLPKRLAEFLPEDRISATKDMMEELLGLHPNARTLIYQASETILHLLELGRVIIVGRGGNVLAGRNPAVFNARVVGSPAMRLERLQQAEKLGRKQALELMHRTDGGRARYLLKYFGKRIDDPLLYDLIINTDRVPLDEAARIIGDAVLTRARSLPPAKQARSLITT